VWLSYIQQVQNISKPRQTSRINCKITCYYEDIVFVPYIVTPTKMNAVDWNAEKEIINELGGICKDRSWPFWSVIPALGLGMRRKTTENCNKIRFTMSPEFKEEEPRCLLWYAHFHASRSYSLIYAFINYTFTWSDYQHLGTDAVCRM